MTDFSKTGVKIWRQHAQSNQLFDLGFLFDFYSVMGSTGTPSARFKTGTLADNRPVAVFRKFGRPSRGPCNKSVPT